MDGAKKIILENGNPERQLWYVFTYLWLLDVIIDKQSMNHITRDNM